MNEIEELQKRITNLEKEVNELKTAQCAGCKARLYEQRKREEQFDLEAAR